VGSILIGLLISTVLVYLLFNKASAQKAEGPSPQDHSVAACWERRLHHASMARVAPLKHLPRSFGLRA
jgi:hypothetical protein